MQKVMVGQEIEESDPPAFRCWGANHAPFLQKCTSPLLSTAAQNAIDGQDTTLSVERSRASIVCAFAQVPVFGAAKASPSSVATHATEHSRAIAITRIQWFVTMTAR